MQENHIILSFFDCWQAIKQARWLILASALFFGFLLFGYYLLKPPTFTAEGIFKGSTQAPESSFSKALEFLGGEESYSSFEDPRVFLRSYPVMEEVVRSLNLQLNISERKNSNILKQIWHTLKAERAQRLIKNKPPPSSILKVPVVSKPIVPDKDIHLHCLKLDYPGQFSWVCEIFFFDERHFQVMQKGKKLGEGEIGKLFQCERGTFALDADPSVKGKSFVLTFIPLQAAAKSLKRSLRVKRSKEHTSLTTISFTHKDRHLAAAIVNTTMEAFQKYLGEEGKRKISKQLGYLQQRQQETLIGLETIMDEHKAYLESHLDSGEMLMLENELAFMAQQQAEARNRLDKIADEMQEIHQVLAAKEVIAFPLLLERLRSTRSAQVQTLTVEGARALIHEHEHALDQIRMAQEEYDYCLTKLSEPDFDTSSLSKVIEDPTLRTRFDQIHALHRNLIDEKNWTAKEREQLHQELDTERLFLSKHIHDLKKGASLKDEVLQGRLQQLNESILFLLLDRYEGAEESLHDLALKAASFPKKWLAEKKIDLKTNLYQEMMESVTKMIEAKNMGYHLDYLKATPLEHAIAPIIPNSPNLFFGFFGGSFLGAFFILVLILLREVWLGPTASYSNLKSEHKHVISFAHTTDDLKNLYYHLKESGKVLGVTAQNPSLVRGLCLFFSKGGEKVLLIDLSKISTTQTAIDTEFGQELILGEPENLKEIFLGSARFHKQLDSLKKSFSRIVFFSRTSVNSLEMRLVADLADRTVAVLRDERWSQINQLPEETLFVTEVFRKRPLTLLQIIPFLEKVSSASFWQHPSKKETEEALQTESYIS